jgi:hypothetical protein
MATTITIENRPDGRLNVTVPLHLLIFSMFHYEDPDGLRMWVPKYLDTLGMILQDAHDAGWEF